MARRALIASCCLILSGFPAGRAQADRCKIGAGLEYSSGTYGGTGSVSQTYVPLSARCRAGRWGVRMTVPYLRVDGPGSILESGGQLVPGPDESRSGLGDIVLGVTRYDVIRSDDARFYLDLSFKAKFGTASRADGLGTGENDYSAQLDLLKDIDRASLYATVGYTLRGDPEGEDLRNTGLLTVGADYRVVNAARVGIMLDYRPSAIDGSDALQEATLYLALRSGGGLSLQPYVVAGFGDSSPEWGAGVSLGWRVRRP